MNYKIWKRMLAFALSCSLLSGGIPIPARATENIPVEVEKTVESILEKKAETLTEESLPVPMQVERGIKESSTVLEPIEDRLEEEVLSELEEEKNAENKKLNHFSESQNAEELYEMKRNEEELEKEETSELQEGSSNDNTIKVTIAERTTGEIHVMETAATSGICGESASWSLDGGTLTISGTGDMYDYSRETMWDKSIDITQVVIEDGITCIGNNCFSGIEIRKIIIPSSVKRIESNAFNGCESLEEVVLPSSLEYLGGSAFVNCTNLNKINIPKDMEAQTGLGAIFANCPLREVSFDDGITRIPDWLFRGTKIEEITIPNTVIEIGSQAFIYSSLKKIVIPSSVKRIEGSAFNGCESLEEVVLPSTLEYLGGSAFANCTNLNKINIPKDMEAQTGLGAIFANCPLREVSFDEGIERIPDWLFRGTKIEEITIPNTVIEIGSQAFAYCDNLTKITYSGTKAKWRQIYIQAGNEPLENEENIEFKAGDGVLELELGYGGKKENVFNPSLFINSSATYNEKLSELAISLATAVYETNDADKTLEHNRTARNFQLMGFSPLESETTFANNHYYEDPDGDSMDWSTQGDNSPSWIVNREIILDGITYNLIFVVVRGTYNMEWIDNFDPGTGDTHMGFDRAADFVCDNLNEYIKHNNITGNIKILVTGHSRGAAVANLIGKKLNDKEVESLKHVNYNDIYVYTYATPNVSTKSYVPGFNGYENIHNIINPEDFVTKVLPRDWDYNRYGKNYILPSRTYYPNGFPGKLDTETAELVEYSSYDEFVFAVSDKVAKYRPNAKGTEYKFYNPYDTGIASIEAYVKIVTRAVQGITSYYNHSLAWSGSKNAMYSYSKSGIEPLDESLFSLFKQSLAYYMTDVYKSDGLNNLLLAAVKWGSVGLATESFFAINGTDLNPQFGCAHTPETYMAMLDLVPLNILKAEKKHWLFTINCPVDITVKNGNGEIIGQIVDNEVITTTGALAMMVEGDSKSFYVYEGADYTIELLGNDTGSMDYSILSCEGEVGELKRDVYLNLPLEKGVTYIHDLKGYDDAASAPLLDSESNVVEKTMTLTEDQIKTLSVKVNVEGKGYASGYENLTYGDYVTLYASTNGFNEFLGWYDQEGNLLSTDTEYSFSIEKNEEFTAKFTNNQDGLWVETIDYDYYTGTAIKPIVKVYDGSTELVEKVDYTIVYKNTTNVYKLSEEDPGFNPKKAPSMTITGKGNYNSKDKEIVYFKILPRSIEEPEFAAGDIALTATGKKQKVNPVLYWKGKAVKRGRDYTVTVYKAEDSSFSNPLGEYVTDSGDYVVRMTGKGNFTGTRDLNLKVTKDYKFVSKLTVSKIPKVTYTGNEFTPVPTVKDGKIELVKDTHYTLSYVSNTEVGKGYVIIKGIPENGYAGTKTVSFTIAKAKVVPYDISPAKDTENRISVDFEKPVVFVKVA